MERKTQKGGVVQAEVRVVKEVMQVCVRQEKRTEGTSLSVK